MTEKKDFARPLIVYLVVTFTLSWFIALPLYLSGKGLAHGFFIPIALAMMTTPMIGALITVFAVERYPLTARDGRTSGWQRLGLTFTEPYRRLFGYFILAWFGTILLVFLALVTSSWFGFYRFDFTELSGLQTILVEQAVVQGRTDDIATVGAKAHEVMFAQIISAIFFSLLNVIPALGEEVGWRGWLMPHLARLGVLPTIVFSGLIWGLWHLPLLALGYNYPGKNLLISAGAMVGMCTVIGALFYWVRLRSRSVWPAAMAHGALNGSASFVFVFGAAPLIYDTSLATILGVTGWIIPGVLVAIIWLTGGFKPAESTEVHTA